MSHIRRISHPARLLATFACAILGLVVSAPAAFAMRVPASGGSSGVVPKSPHPTVTHALVAGGMPGWQIAVIVAMVALLSGTIAVVVDRARAGRRTRMAPAT